MQIAIGGFLCPFTGPDMGDFLLVFILLVTLIHIGLALSHVLVSEQSWWHMNISAVIATLPLIALGVLVFADSRRDLPSERFVSNLADPKPTSVSGIRWVSADEMGGIGRDDIRIALRFDIARSDLEKIIGKQNFKRLSDAPPPEYLPCLQFCSKLSGSHNSILYLGRGRYGDPAVLSVRSDMTHAVFVLGCDYHHATCDGGSPK